MTTAKLWQDWDDSQAKADTEKAAQGGGFSKWLPKFPVGKTVIRILPARIGAKPSPFRATSIHYIELAGFKTQFVCPMAERSLPCPVCTKANELSQSKNTTDQERGKKLAAQYKAHANVYAVDAAQPRAQIAGFSQKAHKTLMGFKNDFGIPFDHPIKGQNICVMREGTGQTDTKYSYMLDPRGGSKLHNDDEMMNAILSSMWDLEALIIVPTFDQIHRMLRGEKVNLEKEGGERDLPAPPRAAAIAAKSRDDDFLDE